jgi:hypothetical protein
MAYGENSDSLATPRSFFVLIITPRQQDTRLSATKYNI